MGGYNTHPFLFVNSKIDIYYNDVGGYKSIQSIFKENSKEEFYNGKNDTNPGTSQVRRSRNN